MSLQANLTQTSSKYLGLNFKLGGRRVADFKFLVANLIQSSKDGKQSCFQKLEEPLSSTLSYSPCPSTPSLAFGFLRIFAAKWLP